MAFPQNMIYVRYEFGWVGNLEIQDTGFWAQYQGPDAPVDPLVWDSAVNLYAAWAVGAWASNWGRPAFSADLTALRCVVYHYDQPLKNVLNRGEAAFTGDSAWAGSATTSLPPQDTVALGMYGYDPTTFVANRARKRGRMYLPTPAPNQISGGGWLTPGAQASFLSQGVNWFNECAAEGSYGATGRFMPVVVSRGGKGGDAAQGVTPISHLRVGRVIDTQRRRRNNIDELYVQGPVDNS